MRFRNLIVVALVLGVIALVSFTGRRKSHDPVAVNVSVTNPAPAARSTSRKTARPPAMTEPTETTPSATAPLSLFEDLVSGETNLNLTTEQLAEYLRQYGTNVETLLATQDKNYIKLAAELYPDDPRVQFAVVTRDIFPGAAREWLDRFKKSAPDNAMADYLSAREYLKAGDRENALKDLAHAATKSRFEDYSFGQVADMEDAQLSAGRTVFEAKVAANYELPPSPLGLFRGLAQEMQKVQKEYIAAGDTASAETLAQLSRSLSQQLLQGEGSRYNVGQQVGLIVERALLNQLPPDSRPSFLNGTVQQRLDELTAHRKHLRELSLHYTDLMARRDETEIISYFDRMKSQGEYKAMLWLQSQAKLRPPE